MTDSPRSILYRPSPSLGAGAQVESVISYFRAACERTRLSTSQVYSQLLSPSMRERNLIGNSVFRTYDRLHGARILSGGIVTKIFVDALEQLVDEPGLINLTFANWNVFGERRPLLHPALNRCWCPHCYDDDVRSGNRTYDRLIWSVKDIEVCWLHGSPLVGQCLSCGKNAGGYFGAQISGFCECGKWLGTHLSPRKARKPDASTNFVQWRAKGVARMLDLPKADWKTVRTSFPLVLTRLATRHHEGVAAKLADHLGRDKSVICMWQNGNSFPAPLPLAEISYAYTLPLEVLLFPHATTIDHSELRKIPAAIRGMRRGRQAARIHPLEQFEREINRNIRAGARSLSIGDLCVKWDIDRSVLRKKVPGAYSLLKAHLAALRAENRRERRAKLDKKVDAILKALIKQAKGRRITRRVAAQALKLNDITLSFRDSQRLLNRVGALGGVSHFRKIHP